MQVGPVPQQFVSGSPHEGFDALGGADEIDHDEHADHEQHRLQDMPSVSLSPNRIASAQPPANAAPNTSAPISIAAEMTVMTLGQMNWRAAEGVGCEPMSDNPVAAAMSPKMPAAASGKGPKEPHRVL